MAFTNLLTSSEELRTYALYPSCNWSCRVESECNARSQAKCKIWVIETDYFGLRQSGAWNLCKDLLFSDNEQAGTSEQKFLSLRMDLLRCNALAWKCCAILPYHQRHGSQSCGILKWHVAVRE